MKNVPEKTPEEEFSEFLKALTSMSAAVDQMRASWTELIAALNSAVAAFKPLSDALGKEVENQAFPPQQQRSSASDASYDDPWPK